MMHEPLGKKRRPSVHPLCLHTRGKPGGKRAGSNLSNFGNLHGCSIRVTSDVAVDKTTSSEVRKTHDRRIRGSGGSVSSRAAPIVSVMETFKRRRLMAADYSIRHGDVKRRRLMAPPCWRRHVGAAMTFCTGSQGDLAKQQTVPAGLGFVP